MESLSRVLRKTLKTKSSFPTEEAATKLVFLALVIYTRHAHAHEGQGPRREPLTFSPAFIAISTGIAEHTLDGTTRPTPEQLDLFDAPSLPKTA